MTDAELEQAINLLRLQGYDVKVIGPFKNGGSLIQVDEMLRSRDEVYALVNEPPETHLSFLPPGHAPTRGG